MYCWWCCHPPPDGKFIHMPFKQHKETKKYQTVGNFCSWECMKAYALSTYSTHMAGIICMYIRCMRNERSLLKSAPSRLVLKQFGGPLTIEEFRKGSSNTIKAHLPEIDHKVYKFVEQTKTTASTHSNSDGKLESIHSSSCVSEPLRLKRTKPLKREVQNNLEKSLGIIKKSSPLAVGRS